MPLEAAEVGLHALFALAEVIEREHTLFRCQRRAAPRIGVAILARARATPARPRLWTRSRELSDVPGGRISGSVLRLALLGGGETADPGRRTSAGSRWPRRRMAVGDNCSACDQPGPCEDQGLCLDPTVIRLNLAGARSDAVPGDDDLYDLSEPGASAEPVEDDDDLYDLSEPASATSSAAVSSPVPTDAYLIEGQLVVRSEDGTWRPISMPAHRSDSANSFHELTPEEMEAMQIPSDPQEARVFLLRQRVDTIPHGNHADFVVGDRLIHVVTGAEEDCGGDCAEECRRNATTRTTTTDARRACDHGAVNVARRRAGGADGAKYMPLVRKTPDGGRTKATRGPRST